MRDFFLGQLAMYAAYHRDPRNRATHHVGVPMIVFSLMVAASLVGITSSPAGSVSLATLLIAGLVLLYALNAPLVGLVALVKYGVLLFAAGLIAAMGADTALLAAAGLFVLGWIIQFWGHAFEGRKPALFDNLLQVFMAPAFLIAEILFALGLEKGLEQEIEARMGAFLPQEEAAAETAA